MINTKCIEIITHLHKPLMPPFKSVCGHLFPIVSRESPILTFYGKIIRRRSCLHFKMEEFRLYPSITSISINADWDIPFENDPIFMSIFSSIFQLQMQVKLHEVMD